MGQAAFAGTVLAFHVGFGFLFGYLKASYARRWNNLTLRLQIIWHAVLTLEAERQPVWSISIAEKTGVDSLIVSNTLRALERQGVLRSYQEYSVPGGRQPRTFYHVTKLEEEPAA